MGSRKHRWPGNDHPLTGVHGGTAKRALRAIQEAKLRRRAEQAVRAAIARDYVGKEIAAFKRKDKMRPRAKKAEQELSPPKPPPRSPWACRSSHRFVHGRRTGEKLMRDIEVTTRQRLLLYIAQEGLCGLCGGNMEGRPFEFSIDHVIPRSLGGQDRLGFLLLCHGECNGAKSNDTPTGCEMVMLLAVNARLGVEPTRF